MNASRTASAAPPAKVLANWYLRSRLKMRHVLLLVALDEQRNMHRAAASASMTQPAATRLLGDLERLLGLRLFERSARGVSPNAHGEILIRHSRAMLATLDHARDDLNALSDGSAGKIVLGTLLAAAPVLVPRAVAQFKLRHPRHTVLIREGTGAALLPALRRGELDLVVARVSSDIAGEGLRFEACYSEPMHVVARIEHPLAGRQALKLVQLAKFPWVVPPPEAPFRRRLDTAFRRAGVEPPDSIVESLSIVVNTMLLRETDSLGVMPRDLARQYAAQGALRILPVKLPAPSGPLGVITAVGRPLPDAAADLVHALRAVAHASRRRR